MAWQILTTKLREKLKSHFEIISLLHQYTPWFIRWSNKLFDRFLGNKYFDKSCLSVARPQSQWLTFPISFYLGVSGHKTAHSAWSQDSDWENNEVFLHLPTLRASCHRISRSCTKVLFFSFFGGKNERKKNNVSLWCCSSFFAYSCSKVFCLSIFG